MPLKERYTLKVLQVIMIRNVAGSTKQYCLAGNTLVFLSADGHHVIITARC